MATKKIKAKKLTKKQAKKHNKKVIKNLRKAALSEALQSAVRVRPTQADRDNFVSTGASQWSTADDLVPSNRRNIKIFEIKKDSSGSISGININTAEARSRVRHYRWLAKDPKRLKSMLERSLRRRERIQDSALFR